MSKEKRSFFERLTGTVKADEEVEEKVPKGRRDSSWALEEEEEEKDGQLTVDVYQTPDDIIIKTMVAGEKPEDLDISITRDLVTIRGKREEEKGIKGDDFFAKELYWGTFSRTVTLPQEIDVEEAEALERHGLLIIRLPRIDKGRQTKLKVKSNS